MIRSDPDPADLSIPLPALGYIIAKAREYDAQTAPVDEESGSNPSDDEQRDVLEATSDNPTRQELIAAIKSLNDDQRVELLAMSWLGRGDYGPAEWSDAIAEAGRRHDRREADYLAGTPLLADYLEEALEMLGHSVDETDDPDHPLT